MKLYSLCTSSHEKFKNEWFLPTLQDPYELILENSSVKGAGFYFDESWVKVIHEKVELILQAIKQNPGEIFIYSDIDIQFFGPTQDAIQKSLSHCDLSVQQDSPYGIMGAGFFACRSNERTLALWKDIQFYIQAHPENHDQEALNQLWLDRTSFPIDSFWKLLSWLRKTSVQPLSNHLMTLLKPKLPSSINIKWNYLPPSFLSGGTLTGQLWEKGMAFPLPPDIILHHANWTQGVENKLAQMQLVRDHYEKRMNV